MKKTLLTLAFSFFIILTNTAAPIDKNNALKIAQNFYQELNAVKSKRTKNLKQTTSLQLDYICQDAAHSNFRSKTDANALYYVFNTENNQGFVIVSGDDKAGKVLAYSTTGNFAHNEMPDNLKFLMDSYKEAIKAIVDSGEESASISARLQNSDLYPPKVLPLLKKEEIEWNQRSPFNDLCPMDTTVNKRAPVGCAAVAIGQIMRYHKHPQKGTGTKEYTTATLRLKLKVDFENTTYDWTKMLPKHNDDNITQGAETAKLLYHVGVSINANYTGTSTSAYTRDASTALVKYFDYKKSIRTLSRNTYSMDDWYSLIKKELNEDRPIIYTGQRPGAGHAFVCDGYDSNNLFHINWGWNGQHNGYFDLAILYPRPKTLYSMGQQIIIGIQPNTTTQPVENPHLFSFEKINHPSNAISKSENFNLSIRELLNVSGIDYEKTTLKVVLENEEFDSYTLTENTEFTLPTQRKYSKYTLKKIKLPSDTPNGIYKLSVQIKNPKSGKYTKIAAKNECLKNLEVKVSSTHIEFIRKVLSPKLQLTEDNIIIKNDTLQQFQTTQLTLKLKNSGTAVFNSRIALILSHEEQKKDTAIFQNAIRIEAGATKVLRLTKEIDLAPGDYTLSLWCNNRNQEEGILNTLVASQNVKILEKEEGGATGIFTNTINKQKALKVYQANSNLKIELPENSQTLYVFDIRGQIIDKKEIRNQKSIVYDASKMRNNVYLLVIEGAFGKEVSKVYIN